MPIPVSTVPKALAYLYPLIVTAVNDPSVVVAYGMPDTNIPEDVIAIGTAVRQLMTWHGLVGSGGAGAMSEEYELEFMVSSYRGGGPEQFQVVFERAWALTSIIDNVVRADPSLGNLVQVAAPNAHDSTLDWAKAASGSQGPLCEVRGTIHVTVSII